MHNAVTGMMPLQQGCPLCLQYGAQWFAQDNRRDYWQCGRCELVFVADPALPSPAEEKRQYDLHQNRVDDPAYRTFLSRLAVPLMQRVPAPARGLDFGCGPGPALAALLGEQGYTMTLYDPLYYPGRGHWPVPFDFITCTEVIEHVHDAASTWQTLFDALQPGGWLGIMTQRVRNRDAFRQWHYKNDPTHVRFYSEPTFNWVARHFRASLELAGPDVALFRKTG